MRFFALTPLDRPVVERLMGKFVDTLAPGFRGLDLSPFFGGRRNIGYMTLDAGAVALFEARPGCFDAHLICDVDYRGRRAVLFGRQAVASVFTVTEAVAITAEIPRVNKPSRIVCRAIGGIPIADTVDTLGRPCTRYILERKAWAASLAGLRKA